MEFSPLAFIVIGFILGSLFTAIIVSTLLSHLLPLMVTARTTARNTNHYISKGQRNGYDNSPRGDWQGMRTSNESAEPMEGITHIIGCHVWGCDCYSRSPKAIASINDYLMHNPDN